MFYFKFGMFSCQTREPTGCVSKQTGYLGTDDN